MASRVTPKGGGNDRLSVVFSGSLFDGALARDVTRWCRGVEEEVGELAVREIQARLDVVLRHPTGYYRSKITSARQGANVAVSDSNVVYGPWLEGVSSRNQSTRFKGYGTFRIAAQTVQGKVSSVGSALLYRYVRDVR